MTSLRSRLIAILVRLVFGVAWVGIGLAAGCGDDPSPGPIGSTCSDNDDCSAGVCINETCLDPAADEDGDGLTNSIEDALNTNALLKDSDGDGINDLDEVVSAIEPQDSDGDGLLDAVESATLDDDQDCVSNQLDSQNSVPLVDPAQLAAKVCVRDGVCGSGGAVASCNQVEGVPVHSCDYSGVTGYSATDVVCDDLDNDCNGVVDDAFVDGTVTWDDEVAPLSKGEACGVGACVGGAVICNINGTGLACSGLAQAQDEGCDGIDNDCDGDTDEGEDGDGCTTYWSDVDGDGAGVDGNTRCLCSASGDYRGIIGGDCADDDKDKGPNAEPICGADNDCSGTLLDAGEVCDDGNSVFGDGCLACAATETSLWTSTSNNWLSDSSVAVTANGEWAVAFNRGYNGQTQAEEGYLIQFHNTDGAWVQSVELTPSADLNTTYDQVQLVGAGDGYQLLWSGSVGDAGGVQVQAQNYDAAGVAVGFSQQLNVSGLTWASSLDKLMLTGGEAVIYWTGQVATGGGGAWAWIDRGTAALPEVVNLVNSTSALNSLQLVPLAGGGFAATWVTHNSENDYLGEIWILRFGADGAPVGDGTPVLFEGGYERRSPRLLARANGGFVLTYTERTIEFQNGWWMQHFTDAAVVEGEPISLLSEAIPASSNYDVTSVDGGVTMVVAVGGYSNQENIVPAKAIVVDLQSPGGAAALDLQTTSFAAGVPGGLALAGAKDQFAIAIWSTNFGEEVHMWFQRLMGQTKLYQ